MDMNSYQFQSPHLVDQYGRKISYLRLSLTDRCNLRCFYCNTCAEYRFIPHEQILTYEECLRIIDVSMHLGLNKVRLTGGEPLVRRNCVHFVERVLRRFPQLDLRMTTNGTLLAPEVKRLKAAGISRVNISLDTLDRQKFQRITGRDLLHRVRRAIDTCLEEGVQVKINTVALKGINDQELPEFVRLAMDFPLDVRFIEFMPVGHATSWNDSVFWPAEEILDKARKIVTLQPVQNRPENGGPARMYDLTGGLGRLGVISPLSNHFCSLCNRYRITPDGRLRTCLFSDKEYTLRPLLCSTKLGDEAVLRVLQAASRRKPIGTDLLNTSSKDGSAICQRDMNAIGG